MPISARNQLQDDVWRHDSGSDAPLMTWNRANWTGDKLDRQTV